MNFKFKGMVFEAMLKRMEDTRARSFSGPAFTWKTKNLDYVNDQKPMFEAVRLEWSLLPEAERKKYGCANFATSPFPTINTAKAFFSEARKAFFKYKET